MEVNTIRLIIVIIAFFAIWLVVITVILAACHKVIQKLKKETQEINTWLTGKNWFTTVVNERDTPGKIIQDSGLIETIRFLINSYKYLEQRNEINQENIKLLMDHLNVEPKVIPEALILASKEEEKPNV